MLLYNLYVLCVSFNANKLLLLIIIIMYQYSIASAVKYGAGEVISMQCLTVDKPSDKLLHNDRGEDCGC